MNDLAYNETQRGNNERARSTYKKEREHNTTPKREREREKQRAREEGREEKSERNEEHVVRETGYIKAIEDYMKRNENDPEPERNKKRESDPLFSPSRL